MIKFDINNCNWWLDRVDKCTYCKNEAAYILHARSLRGKKERMLCESCKQKWVDGELSV